MKSLLGIGLTLCVLGAYLFAPQGCSHLQPIADGAKECAADAYQDIRPELLPKVNDAVACSLSDPNEIPQCAWDNVQILASQYGWDFAMCALEAIAGGKLATPGDSDSAVRQKRAKAIIEKRKATAAQIDSGLMYASPDGLITNGSGHALTGDVTASTSRRIVFGVGSTSELYSQVDIADGCYVATVDPPVLTCASALVTPAMVGRSVLRRWPVLAWGWGK